MITIRRVHLLFLLLFYNFYAKSDYLNEQTNCPIDKRLMVHLFEWKWTDIANECETYLYKTGINLVQISPPNEHLFKITKDDVYWWWRYQPVSYKLTSRSGTEDEFQDMIKRCRDVGIGIIVDTVINHMAQRDQKGHGIGNSSFSSEIFHESFLAVPYKADDFNDDVCNREIENYQDPLEVRLCRLAGLVDLKLSKEEVQNRLAAYMNKLFQMGVGGFRIDAAKHMHPEHVESILAKVNWTLGAKCPFLFLEVIDLGMEPIEAEEYVHLGRVTNFRYGPEVTAAIRRKKDIANFGTVQGHWAQWDSDQVLVFIDNHDNQRGSGAKADLLTYKDGHLYINAVAFMLAYPYGVQRIMSSYMFEGHDMGPPSTGAPYYHTKSPKFLGDNTCDPQSKWVCEHRWPPIKRMSTFQSVVSGQPMQNVQTEKNRIAFARGNVGFFALNNDETNAWVPRLSTGLDKGFYCDLVYGELFKNRCTGDTVTVDEKGSTQLLLAVETPLAITSAFQLSLPDSYRRTIIFVLKPTVTGEFLFVRGGKPRGEEGQQRPIPMIHVGKVKRNPEDYLKWKENDNHLDWLGSEVDQGEYNGQPAKGSPTLWTTNRKEENGYSPMNKYGDHYWMLDAVMDCAQTSQGWFEVKAFTNYKEEAPIKQQVCAGYSLKYAAPKQSEYHIARCGYVNIFEFDKASCTLEAL